MPDLRLNMDRRRLLQALAASSLVAGLSTLAPGSARAATHHLYTTAARVGGGRPGPVTMDFNIRREGIDIAGKHAPATTVDHRVPGPLLELYEGHQAHLRVINHLDEITSIHWHGILIPFRLDGVPGVSFNGVEPGATFPVDFHVRQNGSYWYHSHSGMQEQTGLIGPIVIHPADPDPVQSDRDYVVVLSDWTFDDPHDILDNLKARSDYYNFNQRTVGDFIEDVKKSGWQKTINDRLMWGDMRMSPTDIADVTDSAYRYLMNGLHPAANWTGLFSPGERVRLRFINASAMTYFNVRIPGLTMTVVAADGQNVQPVDVAECQIGVAETFDVVVEPRADQAYTVMAETMDRSGYTRGTLAPRLGMTAPVPPLRKPAVLSMIDMGMDMGDMKMCGMQHGSMSKGGMQMPGMKHGGMGDGDRTGVDSMMDNAGPVASRSTRKYPTAATMSSGPVRR
ncbi:MAG: copper resistance system multicopper oxidase, partial [Salinisphaera sp.]|nr:copper resistance system multicopper oxidase [Salinisphaera sp.]